MKRSELEHILRAAGDIADDEEIVVIGSQAVLGQFPDAPEELCVSMEADVYPLNKPERWGSSRPPFATGWWICPLSCSDFR